MSGVIDASLVTQIAPDSEVSESFRTARTNIIFSHFENSNRVITFTSAVSSEGTSTVACNIATTAAQANKRILLIDANIRNPMCHHFFGLTNSVGLCNINEKRDNVKKLILQTFIPGLSLLPSGPKPSNSSDLLYTIEFAKLIDELRIEFDYVFIDAPALLSFSDALIPANLSDGVVLVVDSTKSKKEATLKASKDLLRIGARVLGVILNRAHPVK